MSVRDDLVRILRNLRSGKWLLADRICPEEDRRYSAILRPVRHAYQLFDETNF